MARGGGEVRTFSIVFEEPRFDESRYSRWVAERFRTVHQEVRLGRGRFLELLDAALGAMDQPTYDGVNSYCVSRVARESGLKVALSGAGGDELFGGYPFFRTAPWLASILSIRKRLPLSPGGALERWFGGAPRGAAGWRKTLEAAHLDPPTAASRSPALLGYQISQMLFPAWVRNPLLAAGPRSESEIEVGLPPEFAEFLEEETAGSPALDQVSIAAWRLFLGERCLRDIDTMSMGVSLEVRAPLTDHEFVAGVLRIPARVRCRGIPDKVFEQELLHPYLGSDYPYRRKQGFLLPFEEWMQDPSYQDRVMGVLADGELVRKAGLAPEVVRGVVRSYHRPRSGIPWSRVWSLFVLVSWCRQNGVCVG
jgi:asparagine synthase (glutamine-hydrolysing)